VVSRLLKSGLVDREVSARDRRFKEVYLTGAGMTALQEGIKRMKQVQTQFLAPLDIDQQEVFLGLIQKLIRGNNDRGRALWRMPEANEKMPTDDAT
jgi:DNA-binding MarR family transcriptional regulator